MNNENYTVDYFIAKFEALADSDVGFGRRVNHCALWHCGLTDPWCEVNEEARALAELFRPLVRTSTEVDTRCIEPVWLVNDGNKCLPEFIKEAKYPRQRILAALHDIKRQQEEAAEELTNLRRVGGDGPARTIDAPAVSAFGLRNDGRGALRTDRKKGSPSNGHLPQNQAVDAAASNPVESDATTFQHPRPSQPVACVHMWLEIGVCMICSATKPVERKELV